MTDQHQSIAPRLLMVASAGVLLRYVAGLQPVWWVVWIAPVFLLLTVLLFHPRDVRWMLMLETLIGASVNFHYYTLVMPVGAAVLSTALQALLWFFIVMAAGRVMQRYRAWWTVFAYPALWAAADTLMAALLPDGNWGSLAYSQGDRLVIFQTVSLVGSAGLVFLLGLVPSALALALVYDRTMRRCWIAYAVTAVLLGSFIFYGSLRLEKPVSGAQTTFGLVSIDDPIGVKATAAYAGKILDEYVRRIGEVAAQGAQVVILPEKVEMMRPAAESAEQAWWSGAARANRVWLEVGIGIDDGAQPTNWAWLFSPDGTLVTRYQKHYMAPPERRQNYASGRDYNVVTVEGATYGLAVCKDMHFAALGRAYGQRHAEAMLVPAWDFDYLDGWIEARTTVARGVENGYSIIRASREGLLTVSDPYGRILTEVPSSAMPGRSLLARAVIGAYVPTVYTRIGNGFGWICVAGAAVFLGIIRRQPEQ